MIVYIYHDLDHCDIEVFDTFEKAENHLKKNWISQPNWEAHDDWWHDSNSSYVNIYKKVVK